MIITKKQIEHLGSLVKDFTKRYRFQYPELDKELSKLLGGLEVEYEITVYSATEINSYLKIKNLESFTIIVAKNKEFIWDVFLNEKNRSIQNVITVGKLIESIKLNDPVCIEKIQKLIDENYSQFLKDHSYEDMLQSIQWCYSKVFDFFWNYSPDGKDLDIEAKLKELWKEKFHQITLPYKSYDGKVGTFKAYRNWFKSFEIALNKTGYKE